jgi:1-acyl-sn-glycerol-3-phosphate acyltransferase
MLNLVCEAVRLFTGAQVRWKGCQPQPVQRIYYANHSSHFDCLVLLSVLPNKLRQTVRPVAAADYWLKKPMRQWFSTKVMRAICIERLKLTKSNNPITDLTEVIDKGDSLIIFPEGGRGENSEIREFKSGLYYLTKARPDVELVPTYIDNANRILPKGEHIPIPMLCSVTFGEPIRRAANETKTEFLNRAKIALENCAC